MAVQFCDSCMVSIKRSFLVYHPFVRKCDIGNPQQNVVKVIQISEGCIIECLYGLEQNYPCKASHMFAELGHKVLH